VLDYHSGELIVVNAKAVLLATGGAAPLYKITAASLEKSGDGLAMAYRAGAEFVDMEMMQFHPTGLIAGDSIMTGTVLEEGLRGAGGHLLNAEGERYMQRYDPGKMERSTRDRVSRSGFMEIRAGRGSPQRGVFLDVRHLGKEFLLKSSPGMYRRCLSFGYDMAQDLIQVTPTAHFQMGGVRIDAGCRSSIKGLFAAGEDAGGVHGANRLGGNGVAESMVFGALAGDAVAAYAAAEQRHEPDPAQLTELTRRFDTPQEGSGNPFDLRARLGETTWEHLGIIRSAASLEQVAEDLDDFESAAAQLPMPAQRAANAALHERINVENLVGVARLIHAAAVLRKESRGSHFREDFPDTDAEYRVNIVLQRKSDGAIGYEVHPVNFSRRTPDQLEGDIVIPQEQAASEARR
jgi:succinate dehydrogenase / fumarate reductase flavoprotein subunit/fumarate reductase flavoprotein subunit